jgi:hypothetical protein
MKWKFMPYMLAMKVGGMPYHRGDGENLDRIVLFVLMKPSAASSRNWNLVGEVNLIVIERLHVIGPILSRALTRGLHPPSPCSVTERHGPLQHQQVSRTWEQPFPWSPIATRVERSMRLVFVILRRSSPHLLVENAVRNAIASFTQFLQPTAL